MKIITVLYCIEYPNYSRIITKKIMKVREAYQPNNCLCSSDTKPCHTPVTAQLLSWTLLVGVGLSEALLEISGEPFRTVSMSASASLLATST